MALPRACVFVWKPKLNAFSNRHIEDVSKQEEGEYNGLEKGRCEKMQSVQNFRGKNGWKKDLILGS